MTDKFDPTKHLIQLKGKDYLQVQHRVMWFKDTHPKGQILTEVIHLDPIVMKATITDNDGKVIATGHGSAQPKPNAVWSGRELEKAETAAVGRALGLAGFGTQFTGDFADGEDDYLADSPQAAKNAQNSPSKPSNAAKGKSAYNGAQNGSQTANTPDGTIDHVLLKEVRVYVKEPETKHRYEFTTEDGRKVYEFSRDKFKELGWIEDTEWNELGTFTIKHAIPVAAKFNATDTGGWWNVETVTEVTF